MAFPHRIIHAHVRRTNKKLTPGHWFYDEGPGWICAEAGLDSNRKWYLKIYYEHRGKPLPESQLKFQSLDDVKAFLSEYFECPVEDGTLPPPDL